MDKETFLNKLKEIGTLEDEVERRNLITDLTDEVSNVYDEYTSLVEKEHQYEEDIEKLRQANMKLFLKVGTDKVEPEIPEVEPEKEPRKFEDLFDEKGNLK